ncbi:SDR family oxidoreductase [Lacunimicrobium album]
MPSSQRSVIITGSSRGIGRAIAVKLGGEGYAVTVNYASGKGPAEEVVAEIVKNGGRAIGVQGDVSKAADVAKLFDETEKAFGSVDGLVNNAGVLAMKNVVETSEADYDRMFDINVKGTFLTLKEAAKRLSDGGRIINFSTSALHLKLPAYATYCATKAAVEVYTQILAKELKGRNITVNAVAPGPVATELFFEGKSEELVKQLASLNPFNRLGEPDDIANVVSFLLSPNATWINGQTIRANGGMA